MAKLSGATRGRKAYWFPPATKVARRGQSMLWPISEPDRDIRAVMAGAALAHSLLRRPNLRIVEYRPQTFFETIVLCLWQGSKMESQHLAQGQRAHTDSPINFFDPTRTLPTGAPMPLLRHNDTESNGRHNSSMLIPVLACVSHNLAPSQCIMIPSSSVGQ